MTPEQLKKKPLIQIIKIEQHEKLDTEEGESNKDEREFTTSTDISEHDSPSDTIADDTEGSKSTEIKQVHNVLNKMTPDGNDTSDENSVIEIKPLTNNEEQNNGKQDKILTTNFEVNLKIKKMKGSQPIQWIKFKVHS